MENTKAPVFFILSSPAICQTRNAKLVKPETFFIFTIITASDAIMQSQCNGMADHKSLFVSNGFALPTRSAEDGRLPETLACFIACTPLLLPRSLLLFLSFFRGGGGALLD